MKKVVITFVFLFVIAPLFSQNTIGFRSSLFWLSFSTENTENEEFNSTEEDIQITRDFDVDLYFINERKEKLRWIYQIGYRRILETRELNAITNGVLDVSTRRRVLIRYRALVGIEKEVNLKPYLLFMD